MSVTAAHRDRLRSAGVPGDVLDTLDLRPVEAGLPEWWPRNGNALYAVPGTDLPDRLLDAMTQIELSGALLAFGSDLTAVASLLLGGDDATVFLGAGVTLMFGEIWCGARSSIVLTGPVVGTARPFIDARNGGSIVAEADQLWAADVTVSTDDMHRLEDLATGERLNPYGAHIRLGKHIWLGRDAYVTGNTEIGEGSVVGARSLVRSQKVPANTAVAGTPARVIREGVTWRGEDTP
ncbi:acyltransferase [Nocardioides sp.]|uniref:acyltransferase n=1 Tax=Nocardioides sp. TaxID=35761 RepID=UPI0039E28863